MIVSTRGRYALRVMVDLAENHDKDRTPLKEIAERQNISQKYIETIMTLLSKNGFVDAIQGKGGGYRGTLAPVACLEKGAVPCERKSFCKTLPVWTKLDEIVENYLDSVTLADLIKS